MAEERKEGQQAGARHTPNPGELPVQGEPPFSTSLQLFPRNGVTSGLFWRPLAHKTFALQIHIQMQRSPFAAWGISGSLHASPYPRGDKSKAKVTLDQAKLRYHGVPAPCLQWKLILTPICYQQAASILSGPRMGATGQHLFSH